MTRKGKVLVAMSGGVDSSVAAKLLLGQGYECIGVTMRLYEPHPDALADDVADARAVAAKLGMPHQVVDYRAAFHQEVIQPFVAAYLQGQTPNPCVHCNRQMKFAKLLALAAELGCDYVATGHYARIHFDGTRYQLQKAVDVTKDQSYFLYNLTPEQLAHVLFPLGDLTKSQVREIAAANGFLNATKPDSQDICFVPDGNYARVIMDQTGQKPTSGPIMTRDGKVIGQHNGFYHYTIGQRKGLGLSVPEPVYVCAIDAAKNAVIVGGNDALLCRELTATNFNWTSGTAPVTPIRCEAKIRSTHRAQPATVNVAESGAVHIVFDTPQRAITPGQTVVLYDQNTVLGGGIICL